MMQRSAAATATVAMRSADAYPFLLHRSLFSNHSFSSFHSQPASGFRENPKPRNGLVFTNLAGALDSFDEMVQMRPLPSIRKFNQLFRMIARNKHYPTTLSLIQLLGLLGTNPLVNPNIYTFTISIHCFCRLGRVDCGLSVLGKILKVGYEPSCAIFTTLIWGLFADGKISHALELFEEIVDNGLRPNAVTCNAVRPNVVTYTCLIQGLCHFGFFKEAMRLPNEMLQRNISPNVVTYTILVDALCKEGKAREAHNVLVLMVRRGVEPNGVTYRALMNGYCLRGDIVEAKKVCEAMISKGHSLDVIGYNILINGYCKRIEIDKAISLFKEMFRRGVSPNVVTYTNLIDGMCKSGKLEVAKELFYILPTRGLKPDVITYTVMINGFCKKGKLSEAEEFLHEMQRFGCTPNGLTYDILVRGYLKHNYTSRAVALIQIMLANGFHASACTITFVSKLLWNDSLDAISKEFLQNFMGISRCNENSADYSRK